MLWEIWEIVNGWIVNPKGSGQNYGSLESDSICRINSSYDAFRACKRVEMDSRMSAPGRPYSLDFETIEMDCFRFLIALCFASRYSTSSLDPLEQVCS